MKINIFTIALLLLLFSQSCAAGKERCKSFLAKIHNIQAQQRHGYSAKKGISLQKKADRARDTWWQCENSVNYHLAKKVAKKTAKRSRNKKSLTKNKRQAKKKRRNPINANILANKKQHITPFYTNKAIVVRNRFKGKKQLAWLSYYQKPKKCHRVKSTKVFAFCMEDKTNQQNLFDQQYRR